MCDPIEPRSSQFPAVLHSLRVALALWISVAALGMGGCRSSGGADFLPDDDDDTGPCKVGQVVCDGKCIDPYSDAQHCGASGACVGAAAGMACGRDHICVNGSCALGCEAGKVLCSGHCIDPLTDATFCGASADCTGANAGVNCQAPAGRCGSMTTAQCQVGRCSTGCPSDKKGFLFTGKIESLTLPACVTEITVKASGAQGGNGKSGGMGGSGATVEGKVCVPPGATLSILVGEMPPAADYPAGGGGGSYVALGTTPLFVAGGGGGAYQSSSGGAAKTQARTGSGIGGQTHNYGGGGGGFTEDGQGTGGTSSSGGRSFLHGGLGGSEYPVGNPNCTRGGFGGGGGASQATNFNAGGGGGFDGGNSDNGAASTGGSSYITPNAENPVFTPAAHNGHGGIEISY